jgi:hypothetical protein
MEQKALRKSLKEFACHVTGRVITEYELELLWPTERVTNFRPHLLLAR